MEYNKNDINRLLTRYENGETTLEEEAALRRLLGEDVCDEHTGKSSAEEMATKAMFEYFNSAASTESRIEIELPSQPKKATPLTIKRNNRITHWLYYTSIAATLALAATVSLSLFKNNKQEEFYCIINGSRLNDKDLAQEQLQSAMSVLSAGFQLVETEKNNAQMQEIDKLLDFIEPANDK